MPIDINDFVKRINYDHIQEYYFSRAKTVSDIVNIRQFVIFPLNYMTGHIERGQIL